MSISSSSRWEPLERWSPTAFLIAGVVFVIDAAIVATNVIVGAEHLMLFGQAFVGAGWTAALIGLLGLYPRLADRSYWLARIGAASAIIGTVTYAVMAIAALVYYAGIPSGEFGAIVPYYLPGVFIGSILGFVAISIAILRTTVFSRVLSVLFLILPAIVIVNFATGAAGVSTPTTILVVVIALAVVMLAIGYRLQTGSALTGREDAQPARDLQA